MRARAIEIAWHEKTSVWSVDVAAADGVLRLVSAGGDKMARVWRLRNPRKPNPTASTSSSKPTTGTVPQTSRKSNTDPEIDVEWMCDLRAHASTVNAVRFSPCGRLLATAADMGEIVLWSLSENIPDPSPAFGSSETSEAKEKWCRVRNLRGHTHDVLDMSWSPCGTYLATASVDNTVMVWTIPVLSSGQPRPPTQLRQSSNFMQGVAFSPDGLRLATLGNDRNLRIFRQHRTNHSRWDLCVSVSNAGAGTQKLFVDDFNSKNIVRRLSWSPDGNLLACPSGVDVHNVAKKLFAVHLFARTALDKPLLQCGGLTKPAIVVRFCPVLFRLRTAKPKKPAVENVNPEPASKVNLKAKILAADLANCDTEMKPVPTNSSATVVPAPEPTPQTQANLLSTEEKQTEPCFAALNYRMVFAVLCTDSLLIYDTETESRPIARIAGLHLAEQTDMCWTADGRNLFISSTDGYVSCVTFSEGELGVELPKSEYPKIRIDPPPSVKKQQSKSVTKPPAPPPTSSINQAQPMVAQPIIVEPRKVNTETKKGPAAFISQVQPVVPVRKTAAMEWQASTTTTNGTQNGTQNRGCIEVEVQKR